MKKCKWIALGAIVGLFCPYFSQAQGLADQMDSLHGVLDNIYDEMIPMCSKLIGVGQSIAGFAATWYIASRVWRHIANAEPIDFYPLFRPFVLGFCILAFPSVLGLINGVMKPTVSATSEMVKGSNKAIEVLLKQKEEALKKTDVWQMYVGNNGNGDRDRWYKYTYGEDVSNESLLGAPGNDLLFSMDKLAYKFSNNVKKWMSEVLQVLYEAASLCINTLRTFQLVVLAILGPLVFGIAVFDGLQHTLMAWLAKYLNVYLWLPVANIFGAIIGKVQEKMIAADIGQIQNTGDTFFSSTDVAYLVFLIIGIVGYFTVPSVANFIVNSGGGGGLLYKVTNISFSTSSMAASAATGGASNILQAGGNLINPGGDYQTDKRDAGNPIGSDPGSYYGNKISGKS
jgi:conjugative transposon TraJ protein